MKQKRDSQGRPVIRAKTAYPSEEPVYPSQEPILSVTGTQIKIDSGGAGQFYQLKIKDLSVKNKGTLKDFLVKRPLRWSLRDWRNG